MAQNNEKEDYIVTGYQATTQAIRPQDSTYCTYCTCRYPSQEEALRVARNNALVAVRRWTYPQNQNTIPPNFVRYDGTNPKLPDADTVRRMLCDLGGRLDPDKVDEGDEIGIEVRRISKSI